MRINVSNLSEALAFKLDELRNAEIQLKKAMPHCAGKVSSGSLKNELKKYGDSCDNKVLKIDRAYNYLMKEPGKCKNNVIDRLIENTKDMLQSPLKDQVRDVLLISCMQTINHYKIAGYKSALIFASELELDTVGDLLEQVLRWEMETERSLSSIAVNEVNSGIF